MGVFRCRGISLIVLAALAVLPVSGTVCAALCAPEDDAAPRAGHLAPASCHEDVSARPELRGAPRHDCSRHDGRAREATARLTAARADVTVLAADQPAGPTAPIPFTAASVRVRAGAGPPGVASPAHAPLVLRI